ncbi:MAG: hypothetical protein ACFFD1_00100 [Candidatus Thorarchaeota archaeon]
MARSGSYDFSLNRQQFVTLVLQSLNLVAKNKTPPSDMMDFAVKRLNIMLKSWMRQYGIKLWNRFEAYVFPAYQTASYSLGSSGDNATKSYVSTTLDGDEASGQTTLSVTSTSSFNNSDKIGVILDDGTLQWSTIDSFVTNDTVTIADALTGSASSGNYVYVYTTKMPRPLRIMKASLYDVTTGRETKIDPMSRDEYFDFTDKTIDSQPNRYFYDPLLDNGILYVYPRPTTLTEIIKILYHEPLEDMDSATDDFDLPSEWYEAIFLNLEYRIAKGYNKYPEADKLKDEAKEELLSASWYNTDRESLMISYR